MMAVTEDGGLFFNDGFHFHAPEFDALIASHGISAKLRMASPCACWGKNTGAADPACKVCFPFGYIYDTAVDIQVSAPHRKDVKHYEQVGSFSTGTVFFTFKSGIVPSQGSRIIIQKSTVSVADILTKGEHDITRFSTPVKLLAAHYSNKVADVGGRTYTRVTVPLSFSGASPDFTFAGRRVTWINNAIPNGTRYTLLFLARTEYIVIEMQDRSENDVDMPYRGLCQRVEYYKHPTSEADTSY